MRSYSDQSPSLSGHFLIGLSTSARVKPENEAVRNASLLVLVAWVIAPVIAGLALTASTTLKFV